MMHVFACVMNRKEAADKLFFSSKHNDTVTNSTT